MGAVKELWMDEYEKIGDEFIAGKIDESEARRRMYHLGFDRDEIDDHLAEWRS